MVFAATDTYWIILFICFLVQIFLPLRARIDQTQTISSSVARYDKEKNREMMKTKTEKKNLKEQETKNTGINIFTGALYVLTIVFILLFLWQSFIPMILK